MLAEPQKQMLYLPAYLPSYFISSFKGESRAREE